MTPTRTPDALDDLRKKAIEPSRGEMDAWLTANCGQGLPHGEANDVPSMLHGLAYILQQIEGTSTYRPHIGQTTAATSALRMALDHFARATLTGEQP